MAQKLILRISLVLVFGILGNVLTATDANGVTITNTYDNAGRVKTRTYSNEPAGQTTPSVSFFYDGKGLDAQQSPNFAKGKLTKVASSISTTEFPVFDNFGRILTHRQITNGQTYSTSYEYNFSGALVAETYPSGKIVRNFQDNNGDLSRVVSGGKTYVSDFVYSATGGVKSLRLGNGRYETTQFNTRQQVMQIALGSNANDTSLWSINYDYGELQTNGSVDGSKNTGNIARQTITLPSTSFVQSYKYDSLYRLIEAKETTNSTQNWIQTFGYDRYGNRTGFGQTLGSVSSNQTPQIDANTNRFVTGQGYVYDLDGNLVQDSQGRQFTFDAENKQTLVKNASNQVIGQYFYDGSGKRVKKVTNLETTIFVYDGTGKLVAEYSTALSQNPTVSYLTTDHLGSPRIITDKQGSTISRRDFMPFGEDLFVGIGGRSESLKYGLNQDDIRQKFSGYPRDKETNLDFAEARYYDNEKGRFTAVDPLLASGKSANPQTFNRYTHVLNNPLVFIDTNGLYPVYWDGKDRFSRTQYKGFTQYEGPPFIIKASNGYYYNASKDELTRTKSWRKAERIRERQSTGTTTQSAKPAAAPSTQSNAINNALLDDLGRRGPALQNIMTGLALLMASPAAAPLVPAGAAGASTAASTAAAVHSSLSPPIAAAVDFGIGFGIGVAGERIVNGSSESNDASQSEDVPNIYVDGSRWPDATQHIIDAQSNGQPSVLTIDRGPISSTRRDAALNSSGLPARGDYDRDEYPPAMFLEGGSGASVRYVRPGDNRGAGSSIQWQSAPYPNGTRVRIVPFRH